MNRRMDGRTEELKLIEHKSIIGTFIEVQTKGQQEFLSTSSVEYNIQIQTINELNNQYNLYLETSAKITLDYKLKS